MPLLTNVQQLVDREVLANLELTGPLEELKVTHPEADFNIYPSIKDPESRDVLCDDCGCATVGVITSRTRQSIRVCRDIIKVLKLASFGEVHPHEVRTYYKLRYLDDLPFVVAQAMPLSEAERQIAAGLMEVDADNDLIIHDLVHLDTLHCPGINCRSKQHPGCFSDCPDLVEVIA